MNIKKILSSVGIGAGAVILGLGIQYAVAQTTGSWTPAPGNPPSYNVPAPINVGSASQIKNGLLGVISLVTDNLNVANGTITATGSVLTNDGSGNASWVPSGGGGSTYHAISPDIIYEQGNDLSTGYPWPPDTVSSAGGAWDCSYGTSLPNLTTVPYPSSIPSNASSVEVQFFVYTNGVGHLWVKEQTPPNTGPLVPVAATVDGAPQADTAGDELDTMMVPYSPSGMAIEWNNDLATCGGGGAVRVIVVGYTI